MKLISRIKYREITIRILGLKQVVDPVICLMLSKTRKSLRLELPQPSQTQLIILKVVSKMVLRHLLYLPTITRILF